MTGASYFEFIGIAFDNEMFSVRLRCAWIAIEQHAFEYARIRPSELQHAQVRETTNDGGLARRTAARRRNPHADAFLLKVFQYSATPQRRKGHVGNGGGEC